MQIWNKGMVRLANGTLAYMVKAHRASGDMNTSTGNVLLMCAMMFAYKEHCGVNFALINDVDDCVCIMERKDRRRFEADVQDFFDRLGFIMKVEEPVEMLEHIEFCQSRPVQVTEGVWRMVRDPRTCLVKDSCTLKHVAHAKDWDRYRDAKSQCGLALAGDMPIFNEFYSCLGRGVITRGKREVESGMEYLAVGMDLKYKEPTTISRVSFFNAFGIDADTQIALEKFFRSRTPEYRGISQPGVNYSLV
jgi:hypothetical protein